MLSFPTIHPFHQISCFHPIKAAFCSTNTHLGPPGATTLLPKVGGSFLPSPTSAEGQGCSSVFPSCGIPESGFCPPKLQELGVEGVQDRESHPHSHPGQ